MWRIHFELQYGTSSSILLLVANGHHNCIECTTTDVRLRTPDDGQKSCPKTCTVVIPIKLELSASVGFNHKESVTMHYHTIVKKVGPYFVQPCFVVAPVGVNP